MSTLQIFAPSAARRRSPLGSVGAARRWVRETPAPRWEGTTGDKATFVGYVGASMVGWTFLGLAASAAFGQLLGLAG
ncbi:hypothetical protein [Pengzhenrongella sicca]|uniref:Uncharacterized protein n=1 Tax=Pengzhenrongella sicca TaxID=2819238 RepID=A0A8A4Z7B1_9MICO|nr:hypothetical protein [Pengzhenrongella sicca]QTE27780.1 hypothetical protein J4E96_10060 [Pengzhenrongella sicca]